MLNSAYIIVQISYCEVTKTKVYPVMDWVDNPRQASKCALGFVVITFAFFCLIQFFIKIKLKINGLEKKVKKALDQTYKV